MSHNGKDRLESIAHTLLQPTSGAGVYARTALFEQVIESLSALISRLREPDTEILRFPPVMSRRHLERSGYLQGFPHLLGCVSCLHGEESEIRALVEGRDPDRDWVAGLSATDLVLSPAACYPLYPLLSAREHLPAKGLLFDVASYCFRRERSYEIDRLQAFQMREFVCVGTSEQTLDLQARWISRAQGLAKQLALPYKVAPASDPFFGRAGKLMAMSQIEQSLKFELLIPLHSELPTACMSFNYHRDHFGTTWNLMTERGEVAHTACVAFGLDRLALALFATHGVDLQRWPAVVRETLWPDQLDRAIDEPAQYKNGAAPRQPYGGKVDKVGRMRNETIAVHGGYEVDPTTRAVAVPIYQTVAYAFDSAEHGAALFNLETEGYRYSRIGNPTNAVLERRIAALEGGLEALSVSSGQAALHYSVLNLTEIGRNIVSVPQLYGTTHTLFAHVLPKLGISIRFAETDNPAALEKLIDKDTRAVFCESVGNPAGNICDVEALANLAHKHGVPLIVDNTVATPIVLRPIDYGADIVVHSLTKFMGGHGTTLGGIVVDSGKFPWEKHAQRFPMFNEPDASYSGLVYTQHFGPAAYIARCRSVYQRTMGSVLSPLSAFLLLQGIETVALRIDRHIENGRRVAEFLRADPRVDWVNYGGFPDNPYHALAQKYLGGRACSLMTFGIRGGFEGGTKFYNALKLIKRLVNLGDAKSLACHPASTTHRQMSVEEQRKAGVKPETIRLSIGIEHADDIIADLDQALDAAAVDRKGSMDRDNHRGSATSM